MNTGKQINAMIALLLLLLLLVGVYTIWDPFRAEAEAERTHEEVAERGAKVYIRNCRQCHGNTGEGRIGPALNPEVRARNPNLLQFADPNRRREMETIVQNTITCGRIGTIMPPWSQEQGGSLIDEQIRQLVILITNPPKDAWKHVSEISHEEDETVPLPPVTEITAGAAPTGATSYVCGQRAPEAQVDTGPVEASTSHTQVGTDNRFSLTRMGAPANQEVTVAFENRGAALHNWAVKGVKDTRGQDVATRLLPGGQSETIRFTIATPGTYQFICDVHPAEMKGQLVVQ